MPSETPASPDAPCPDRSLSVRLPMDQYDRLAELAWERRSSASALAREALREHYALADGSSPAPKAA
jgi:Ribbon-helix-helix protein, copG family